MKTKLKPIVILLCVVVVIAVLISLFVLPPMQVQEITLPTVIQQTGIHPANNRQGAALIWLGCYNGKLYYFGKHKAGIDYTKFDDALCVFENGSLLELTTLSHQIGANTGIIGLVDKYLYYRESKGSDKESTLYCYNLENNQDTKVYTGELYPSNAVYFADDGTVYVPLWPKKGEEAKFAHVFKDQFLGIENLDEGYTLNNKIYHVVSEYSDTTERIVETDSLGVVLQEAVSFEWAYDRSIIPYADGLLVHNGGAQNLLYRIDKNGVTELFNIPCLSSVSAVNVHDTTAYISVLRYEKNGEYGQIRYENDTVEGTYRIDLTDGSIEKINDYCFDGIYNFDGDGFYCSTKTGEIYRMAFDGTVSPVLLLEENPFSLASALS